MSTATTTMTTQEVADRLVSLFREGKFVDAIEELYAPHVVSIEPEGGPGPSRVEGFDHVINKSIEFGKSLEKVHSMAISEALGPVQGRNTVCPSPGSQSRCSRTRTVLMC